MNTTKQKTMHVLIISPTDSAAQLMNIHDHKSTSICMHYFDSPMKKLKLTGCCLVKPAEKTWTGSLPLSELDQIGSLNYVSLIHLYKPPQKWLSPPEAIFEALKNSLAKVLVPFHPLAGRLSRVAGGRLEIECNAMGALLTEAESEATLDNLREFDFDHYNHQHLVPTVDEMINGGDGAEPINELPLVAVRLTRFACGGVCIGVAMSHAAVDGQSAAHFYTEWARLARGDPIHAHPFLDRTLSNVVVESPLAHPPPPPPEFDAPPRLLGDSSTRENGRTTAAVRASLRLTKFQVEILRKIASENSRGRYFTRYEAVTAHIWRCACKARRHAREQRTRLSISVDLRRRVRPPLPETYMGNAVLDVAAWGCSGDLVTKPLSYAAGKIREAIDRVTSEYVSACMDYLSSVDDLSSLQENNNDDEDQRGNPNLSVASWLNLQFQGVDFGWGKEIYMGPVDYGSDGDCLILPGGNESDDRSVRVVVCLEEAYMESFKKLFYQEIELLVDGEVALSQRSGGNGLIFVDAASCCRRG